MAPVKNLRAEDYTVGWIVALIPEYTAAKKMLDHVHEPLPQHDMYDRNVYTYGDLHGHNIVIVHLDLATPGKVSAQRTISQLPRVFTNMHIHLFVGIGGGVPPSKKGSAKDVRLGDVVISKPERSGTPAIVEYDLKRVHGGAEELAGLLDKPGREVVQALTPLLAEHHLGKYGEHKYDEHLSRITEIPAYKFPGREYDILFPPDYEHRGEPESPCPGNCDRVRRVPRNHRDSNRPVIHQGTILSGDTIMKDARKCDEISQKYFNGICFETEAAGVMDDLKPIIIRGIADYADTHKTGYWQNYAAATAAAFAREILCAIQPVRLDMRQQNKERALIGQKVDSAYTKFDHRIKGSRLADLEDARKLFLDVEAELSQLEVFDSFLHRTIQWGLMVVEKELSCWRHFDLPTRMGHINEAEAYCAKIMRTVSQCEDARDPVQVKIEYYILKGLKARLKFEQGADKDQFDIVKRDVVVGFDTALKQLKTMDEVRFKAVFKNNIEWRDHITKSPF